jgi:hypothetical protein
MPPTVNLPEWFSNWLLGVHAWENLSADKRKDARSFIKDLLETNDPLLLGAKTAEQAIKKVNAKFYGGPGVTTPPPNSGNNNTPSEGNTGNNPGGSGGGGSGGGGGPVTTQDLPGVEGSDYSFVRFGGRTYVVYFVDLPNGKRIKMSWKVDEKDFERFGVTDAKVRNVSQAEFSALEYFGNAGEITLTGEQVHPFQTYIKKIREQQGNVSWLSDREFMSQYLMGYAEGIQGDALLPYLKQTDWYQSRTDRMRSWELDINKADRHAQIQATRTQMMSVLQSFYGPTIDLVGLGFTDKKLKAMAEKIAGGFWGDPSDGMAIWAEQQRQKALLQEGSPAWIDQEQQLEAQRGFMNKPEEIRGQLRDQARQWLGPSGQLDNDTLTKWANNLASGIASEEDWTNFLSNQARSLYPWLSTGESWQDRASAYRNIAENLLGQPVGWDSTLLRSLGGLDANGKPNGAALSFDEFEKQIRSSDAFYKGPVGRQEGWDVYAQLANSFTGQTF